MTARRGYGESSLFYSESAGRWFGFIDFGRDGTGKRRRVKVSGRTRVEAMGKLREVRDARDAGLPRGDQRQTVAEWLDAWLRQLPASVKSQNTVDNLTWVVESHLKPSIGQRRLRDLSPDDVDAMLRVRADAGLSRSSLVRIHSTLSRSLRMAERRGKVPRNVAQLVDVPEGPVKRSRSLTVAQAQALLSAAQGDRLEAQYETGLMLGLRPGELLALRWSDVDLDSGTLRVVRSLKRERGQLVMGDTKTRSSRRALKMPRRVDHALRVHRGLQSAERLRARVWLDADLVFTNTAGGPLDPSNLRRGFSVLTNKAKIGHWHPHELRHSAASILSASGVPLEQIADVLGHSGTRTTSAVYRHLIEPTVRAAADTMDTTFAEPMATSLATGDGPAT